MTAGGKDESKQAMPAQAPKCPICGQPRDLDYRPFCSKRCSDVDLGRWLNGSYAIPAVEGDDEDGEDRAEPSPDARGNGATGEPH